MATIGMDLPASVWTFFDGVRSYDAEGACTVLAEDASWHSPWFSAQGKAAVQEALSGWLGDAVKRPSLTISDFKTQGAVTHLVVSVSNRFGAAPKQTRWSILSVRGTVHQVRVA